MSARGRSRSTADFHTSQGTDSWSSSEVKRDDKSLSFISDVRSAVAQIEQRLKSPRKSKPQSDSSATVSSLLTEKLAPEFSNSSSAQSLLFPEPQTVNEKVQKFEAEGLFARHKMSRSHSGIVTPPPPPSSSATLDSSEETAYANSLTMTEPSISDTFEAAELQAKHQSDETKSEVQSVESGAGTEAQLTTTNSNDCTKAEKCTDDNRSSAMHVQEDIAPTPEEEKQVRSSDAGSSILSAVKRFEQLVSSEAAANGLEPSPMPAAGAAGPIVTTSERAANDAPAEEKQGGSVLAAIAKFETSVEAEPSSSQEIEIESGHIASIIERFESPEKSEVPVDERVEVDVTPLKLTEKQIEVQDEMEKLQPSGIDIKSIGLAPQIVGRPVESQPPKKPRAPAPAPAPMLYHATVEDRVLEVSIQVEGSSSQAGAGTVADSQVDAVKSSITNTPELQSVSLAAGNAMLEATGIKPVSTEEAKLPKDSGLGKEEESDVGTTSKEGMDETETEASQTLEAVIGACNSSSAQMDDTNQVPRIDTGNLTGDITGDSEETMQCQIPNVDISTFTSSSTVTEGIQAKIPKLSADDKECITQENDSCFATVSSFKESGDPSASEASHESRQTASPLAREQLENSRPADERAEDVTLNSRTVSGVQKDTVKSRKELAPKNGPATAGEVARSSIVPSLVQLRTSSAPMEPKAARSEADAKLPAPRPTVEQMEARLDSLDLSFSVEDLISTPASSDVVQSSHHETSKAIRAVEAQTNHTGNSDDTASSTRTDGSEGATDTDSVVTDKVASDAANAGSEAAVYSSTTYPSNREEGMIMHAVTANEFFTTPQIAKPEADEGAVVQEEAEERDDSVSEAAKETGVANPPQQGSSDGLVSSKASATRLGSDVEVSNTDKAAISKQPGVKVSEETHLSPSNDLSGQQVASAVPASEDFAAGCHKPNDNPSASPTDEGSTTRDTGDGSHVVEHTKIDAPSKVRVSDEPTGDTVAGTTASASITVSNESTKTLNAPSGQLQSPREDDSVAQGTLNAPNSNACSVFDIHSHGDAETVPQEQSEVPMTNGEALPNARKGDLSGAQNAVAPPLAYTEPNKELVERREEHSIAESVTKEGLEQTPANMELTADDGKHKAHTAAFTSEEQSFIMQEQAVVVPKAPLDDATVSASCKSSTVARKASEAKNEKEISDVNTDHHGGENELVPSQSSQLDKTAPSAADELSMLTPIESCPGRAQDPKNATPAATETGTERCNGSPKISAMNSAPGTISLVPKEEQKSPTTEKVAVLVPGKSGDDKAEASECSTSKVGQQKNSSARPIWKNPAIVKNAEATVRKLMDSRVMASHRGVNTVVEGSSSNMTTTRPASPPLRNSGNKFNFEAALGSPIISAREIAEIGDMEIDVNDASIIDNDELLVEAEKLVAEFEKSPSQRRRSLPSQGVSKGTTGSTTKARESKVQTGDMARRDVTVVRAGKAQPESMFGVARGERKPRSDVAHVTTAQRDSVADIRNSGIMEKDEKAGHGGHGPAPTDHGTITATMTHAKHVSSRTSRQFHQTETVTYHSHALAASHQTREHNQGGTRRLSAGEPSARSTSFISKSTTGSGPSTPEKRTEALRSRSRIPRIVSSKRKEQTSKTNDLLISPILPPTIFDSPGSPITPEKDMPKLRAGRNGPTEFQRLSSGSRHSHTARTNSPHGAQAQSTIPPTRMSRPRSTALPLTQNTKDTAVENVSLTRDRETMPLGGHMTSSPAPTSAETRTGRSGRYSQGSSSRGVSPLTERRGSIDRGASPRGPRKSLDQSFSRLPRVAHLTGNEGREKAEKAALIAAAEQEAVREKNTTRSKLPRGTTFSGVLPRVRGSMPLLSREKKTSGLSGSPVTPQDSNPTRLPLAASGSSSKPRRSLAEPGERATTALVRGTQPSGPPLRRTLSFNHGQQTGASSGPVNISQPASPAGVGMGGDELSSGSTGKLPRRGTFSMPKQSILRIPKHKPTVPEPFRLSGLEVHERTQHQLEQARRRAAEMESRRRAFKARPMPDFSHPSPKPFR